MIGGGVITSVECVPIRSKEKEPKLTPAVMELDDFALIQKTAQGDETALSALYDRYSRLVYSVAYGVVQDREIAEEVTLDIFTAVWEKANTYDPQLAKVSTWLTRMARNRGIDRLRREKARPHQHAVGWAELTSEPLANQPQPEAAVQLHWERRVRTALASLPPAQQEVLSLAYFQGYSHSEIAEALNQPLGTVKGRIRSAMQTLRGLLGEAG